LRRRGRRGRRDDADLRAMSNGRRAFGRFLALFEEEVVAGETLRA